MRLYTDYSGNWYGTQREALRVCKAAKTVDVPTVKAELLEFLNTNKVGNEEPFLRPDVEEAHPQSCSANTEYRDPSAYDVKDVVLNCDRKHLGSALGAIISRLHDELGDV